MSRVFTLLHSISICPIFANNLDDDLENLAGDLNEKKNWAGDFATIKIRIEIMSFQGSSSRLGLS